MSKRKPKKTDKAKAPARTSIPFWTIAVLALLLRLIYLAEIGDTPTMQQPIGDGESYHLWAQEIADGDWLGDEIFYAAPLYPYLMGVVYTVAGPNLMAVRILQMLFASLACLLLADAGRRLFDRPTGLALGIIAAVYPLGIYFDGLIQKASLTFSLIALLVWLMARFKEQMPVKLAPAMGVVLGMLALTRENALVFLPIILLWLWLLGSEKPAPKRLLTPALLLLGFALVILPVTLRNKMVADQWVITTSNLGTNLWIGNNPDADGRYQPLLPGRGDWKFEREDALTLAREEAGTDLSPGQVSSFWRDKTLAAMAEDPVRWLSLMVRKSLLVLNNVEIADTEDIYTYRGWSLLLTLLHGLFPFGVLAALAVIGVWATRDRYKDLWPLYLMALAYLGSVVLFFVFDRFRFPLAILLMPFAAAGIQTLIAQKPFKTPAKSWPMLAGALLIFALSLIPFYSANTFTTNSHVNLGNLAAKAGDHQKAVGHYEDALAQNQNLFSARVGLGNALINLGRTDEAIPHLQQAIERNPNNAEAQSQYGLARLMGGDARTAVTAFRKAVELDDTNLLVLNNLAWVLATSTDDSLRNGPEALRLAERANQLSGGEDAGYLDTLAAAQAEAGLFEDAVVTAEKSLTAAKRAGDAAKQQRVVTRLNRYRNGQPHRQ